MNLFAMKEHLYLELHVLEKAYDMQILVTLTYADGSTDIDGPLGNQIKAEIQLVKSKISAIEEMLKDILPMSRMGRMGRGPGPP